MKELLRKIAKYAFVWLAGLQPCYAQVAWDAVKPETKGLNTQAIGALFQDLKTDPHKDIKGVVILRDGELVAESYFNGDTIDTLHDIRSATKSITSALVGIAIERHYIHGIDDPIAQYLPRLPQDGKQKITLRDLLNMRSGLDANDENASSTGSESVLDQSSDWVKSTYAVHMKYPPGQKYVYASINAFLAGLIVENATKQNLDAFAKQVLFDPIGIRRFEWRRVPINHNSGQGNLSITTRDEARIGELFLDGGELHGHHILDADWIKESLSNQVDIAAVDPYADYYGYMWYSKEEMIRNRRILVHFASGNGGNKIYIIPSLDMVIAITSSAYNQKYGQRRSQDILLKILAAASPT
jgi:CubicO group peptidase (beta-lactamase class C family)